MQDPCPWLHLGTRPYHLHVDTGFYLYPNIAYGRLAGVAAHSAGNSAHGRLRGGEPEMVRYGAVRTVCKTALVPLGLA